MIQAAKSANIHEFILTLPEDYNTYIGEGGGKFVGWKSRCLQLLERDIKNAPNLLLDEATSALVNENEYIVKEELEALMKIRQRP